MSQQIEAAAIRNSYYWNQTVVVGDWAIRRIDLLPQLETTGLHGEELATFLDNAPLWDGSDDVPYTSNVLFGEPALSDGGRWLTWDHQHIYTKDGIVQSGHNRGRKMDDIVSERHAHNVASAAAAGGDVKADDASKAHEVLSNKLKAVGKRRESLEKAGRERKLTSTERRHLGKMREDEAQTKGHIEHLANHVREGGSGT